MQVLHFSARPTANLPWTPPVPLFQADGFTVSSTQVSVAANSWISVFAECLNCLKSQCADLSLMTLHVQPWKIVKCAIAQAMPQPQTPYGPRVAGRRVAWVASLLTCRSRSSQMLGVFALITGSVPVAPPLHSAWPARQLHCSWATGACVYKLSQGHHPWCFPFTPERERERSLS